MQTVYLGLGSNLGDRLAMLNAAVESIARAGITVVDRSSVFVSAPQGEVLDQPDFYNAAVRVRTRLGPDELLAACKQIELALGRDPSGPRHGPRPVDIDLLLLGSLRLESERLTLPHRDLVNRRFVLEPLLELDPELQIGGERLSARLQLLADQPVARLSEAGWPGPGRAVDRRRRREVLKAAAWRYPAAAALAGVTLTALIGQAGLIVLALGGLIAAGAAHAKARAGSWVGSPGAWALVTLWITLLLALLVLGVGSALIRALS